MRFSFEGDARKFLADPVSETEDADIQFPKAI